jgi:Uncharacterized conserved protein
MIAGLELGIDLFNSGEYWDAHEAWEHEWMHDRKGPDGDFYKGLIQVATGCLHYGRHNRRGAVNKWRSGADYLRPYLPAKHGVRLSPLVATVDEFLTEMTLPEWPPLTMPKIVRSKGVAARPGLSRPSPPPAPSKRHPASPRRGGGPAGEDTCPHPRNQE